MPSIGVLLLVLVSSFSGSSLSTCASQYGEDDLQTYIVHVRSPPPEHTGSRREWHESFLVNSSRLLHSYSHVLSGFSALLTGTELDSIRKLDGFVDATLSIPRKLHTTHSPSFLKLNPATNGFWAESAKFGEGVIIGVLDTGIAPSHPSFNGTGLPAPPTKWKGRCNFNTTSLCSNKLIGGRSFFGGIESSSPPLDDDGHGTHTAGTAAGRFVSNASVLGSALGTAAGIAPYAHLAAYKVCWKDGCDETDVTAGIDAAVADGVDVISVSIGGVAVPLYNDSFAIATFSAVKQGVFVAMSAGNNGPSLSTVANISPWVLTVGASTMDRRIRAIVKLGNGTELVGESAYQPSSLPDYLPLVYPELFVDANASFCTNSTALRNIGVEGKVVVCMDYNSEEVEKGKIVKEAGGAAMIVWGSTSAGFETYASAHVIPTSHVSYVDGLTLLDYIQSTSNPVATIHFNGTAIGGQSDPAVAAFSSRGPSRINSGILKPDIIGPGVNVLAAWHTTVGAFPVNPPFNMISGTSMSCPHLAGVAALLRRSHPDWSPAMIKSAIMTTAELENSGGTGLLDNFDRKPANLFEAAAGHVNPARANNPGLVYDITTDEYISYLCGLGYTDVQVQVISSDSMIRCANYTAIAESDLNYPSISASLSTTGGTVQIRRTLTHVGSPNSSYAVITSSRPFGVTMDVLPSRLDFATVGEKQAFSVTFGINSSEPIQRTSWISQGFLLWVSSDSLVAVQSPVSVSAGFQ